MSTKYPLASNRKLSYAGLLNANEVREIADSFFMDRGYDRYDLRNTYLTTKKGRLIELETRYEKQYSDDDLFEAKLTMIFADLQPVTIELNGKKKKMEKGRLKIIFDTHLRVNDSGNWSGSPIKTLFQYLAAFFIFKHHYDTFKKDAKKDIDQLYDKLLHFLNGGNSL